MKKGKGILIAGGSGFIGYNLSVRLLDEGYDVHVIDCGHPSSGFNAFHATNLKKRSVHLIDDRIGNMAKYESVLKECGTVFNCAALISHLDSMKSPVADMENNTVEHVKFLEVMRKHPDKRLIYLSTRQIYGRQRSLPVTEESPVMPVDVNGINKYSAEMYHSLYSSLYGINSLILRITNVYGPAMHIRDKRLSFMGWFINRAVTNNHIELYGDGSNRRDMLYIDDLCTTLIKSIGSGATGIFNIGGSETLSLKEIAGVLKGAAGSIEIEYRKFPPELEKIDIGSFQFDDSKARQALGHNPSTVLASGIERTLEYFNKYKGYYL